jgi:hypothetical protein
MLPLNEVQSAVEKLAFCMFNSIGSLCRDSKPQVPTTDSHLNVDEFNQQMALEFANEMKETRQEIQMLLEQIQLTKTHSLQELQQQIQELNAEDSALSLKLLEKTKLFGKN